MRILRRDEDGQIGGAIGSWLDGRKFGAKVVEVPRGVGQGRKVGRITAKMARDGYELQSSQKMGWTGKIVLTFVKRDQPD